ncbi:hypothetical protein MED01_004296 [Micromonospora sp. MED01]|uniref:hypothetical protein n=1 Tax=Micromonospora alfalfae TaxID=2911212 RepID=UPI001EE86473|nr:hypothetical protein [Micromonospora alfalfae]MCG5460870.1 hypothetical protein [Micromonospora alfalfae]
MCAINGKCGCNRVAGGIWEFVLVGGAQLVWWLVKLLARAVRLLFVALLAVSIWASPRGWRLARRAYRAGRHRWLTRPVVLDQVPVAAVTATTTAPTLADLGLKQEANVR